MTRSVHRAWPPLQADMFTWRQMSDVRGAGRRVEIRFGSGHAHWILTPFLAWSTLIDQLKTRTSDQAGAGLSWPIAAAGLCSRARELMLPYPEEASSGQNTPMGFSSSCARTATSSLGKLVWTGSSLGLLRTGLPQKVTTPLRRDSLHSHFPSYYTSHVNLPPEPISTFLSFQHGYYYHPMPFVNKFFSRQQQ